VSAFVLAGTGWSLFFFKNEPSLSCLPAVPTYPTLLLPFLPHPTYSLCFRKKVKITPFSFFLSSLSSKSPSKKKRKRKRKRKKRRWQWLPQAQSPTKHHNLFFLPISHRMQCSWHSSSPGTPQEEVLSRALSCSKSLATMMAGPSRWVSSSSTLLTHFSCVLRGRTSVTVAPGVLLLLCNKPTCSTSMGSCLRPSQLSLLVPLYLH